MPTKDAPLTVLMVDDDASDTQLANLILDEMQSPVKFHSTSSVDEAIDFLNREGEHLAAPAPDFILLDLNMPGRSGFELLHHFQQSDASQPQVIVLTSSAQEATISRAYEMGADLVLTKPVELDDYHAVMRDIDNYWRNHFPAP